MSKMNTFYKLQQPYPDEVYSIYGRPVWDGEFGAASWSEEVTLETIRCPIYPGHQRAGRRIGDLSVVLQSKKVGDFVWTWYSDCLITEKVLHLFQQAGLTGFIVKPVQIKPETEKGEKLTTIPKLQELVVTGKGGDADLDSGIHLIYTCPHCNLIEYSSFRNGIIVDEQAWDGSDFFTVTGYQFILVTEKVKELMIEHRLTNCALIPSQNLEWGTTVRPEDVFSKYNGQKDEPN